MQAQQLVIAGAPQLSVLEGEALIAAISINGGDPARVLQCADLVFTASDPGGALVSLGCAMGNVGPELVAVAGCDVVVAATNSAVISIEVSLRDRSVAPASAAVQVLANDATACLPRVSFRFAPSGICAPAQPDDEPLDANRGNHIALDRGEGGALCADVTSLDPAIERLWLVTTSNAPATLMTLPNNADSITSHTLSIPIAENPGVVGRFAVDVAVFRADPATVPEDDFLAPALKASATLTLGGRDQDSIAVELLGRGPDGSITAEEFAVAEIPLRIWRFGAITGADGYCVRAVRTTDMAPLDPPLPFLSLSEPGGVTVGAGDALCVAYEPDPTMPTLLALRVAPPIDAASLETIAIDIGVDSGGTASNFTRSDIAMLRVIDRAEDLPCNELDPQQRAVAACADVDGDGDPELLVATRSTDACAFRRSGASYEALLSDPAFTPRAVKSFMWAAPRGPRAVILGQDGGRALRLLGINGTQIVWTIEPSLALPIDPPVNLSDVVPVAQAPGDAATHFAYGAVSGTAGSIQLQSISGAASGQITDIQVSGVIESVHVEPLDFGDDAINDFLFFAVSDLAGRPTLEVVAVSASTYTTTSSCSTTAVCTSFPVTVALSADLAAAAAIYGGAAGQTLYAITEDAVSDASILAFTDDPSGPVSLVAPGPALSMVASGDRLFAALASGVYELIPDEAWKPQDPVLRQGAPNGEIPLVQEGYGQGIASCLGGPPALVFPSSGTRMRYAEIDVPVEHL